MAGEGNARSNGFSADPGAATQHRETNQNARGSAAPQLSNLFETTRAPFISPKQPDRNACLLVGKGVKLNGDVPDCGTIAIEGSVEANVRATSLQIARGAYFRGEAKVEEADIDGRFDGVLFATGKVIIRRGARLAGRLNCGQIEVEAGAEIQGSIRMQSGMSKDRIPFKWPWHH